MIIISQLFGFKIIGMLLQLKMVAVHEISNDTFEMKKKSKIKNE
jgi:hypothetical protein